MGIAGLSLYWERVDTPQGDGGRSGKSGSRSHPIRSSLYGAKIVDSSL